MGKRVFIPISESTGGRRLLALDEPMGLAALEAQLLAAGVAGAWWRKATPACGLGTIGFGGRDCRCPAQR